MKKYILISTISVVFALALTVTGQTARSSAMGGTGIALSDEGGSVFINPAGLANLRHLFVSSDAAQRFYNLPGNDIYTGQLGFGFPINRCLYGGCARLGLGLGGWYFTSGVMKDIVALPALGIGFGGTCYEPAVFSLGFRGKIAFRSYDSQLAGNPNDPLIPDGSVLGYGLDAGVMFSTQDFGVGIFADNVLSPDFSEGRSADAPEPIKIGLGLRYSSGTMHFLADAIYPMIDEVSENDILWRLGAEIPANDWLKLRFGIDGKTWMTAGAGLYLAPLRIDLAYKYPGPDGPVNVHWLEANLSYYGHDKTDVTDLRWDNTDLQLEVVCGEVPGIEYPIDLILRRTCCKVYNNVELVLVSNSDPLKPIAIDTVTAYDFNKTKTIPVRFESVPVDLMLHGKLIARIDPSNEITEKNEANNDAMLNIKVVGGCRDIGVEAQIIGGCNNRYCVEGFKDSIYVRVWIQADPDRDIPDSVTFALFFEKPDSATPILTKQVSFKGLVDTVSIGFAGYSLFNRDSIWCIIDYGDKILEETEVNNIVAVQVPQSPKLSANLSSGHFLVEATYREVPLIPMAFFDRRSSELKLDSLHNGHALFELRERLRDNPDMSVQVEGYLDILSDAPKEDFDEVEFRKKFGNVSDTTRFRKWSLARDNWQKRATRGNWSYFNKLASNRAKAVRDFLRDGLDNPRRVTINMPSYVDKHINNCLHPNIQAWAENRRVEIHLVAGNHIAFYEPFHEILYVDSVIAIDTMELNINGFEDSVVYDMKLVNEKGKPLVNFGKQISVEPSAKIVWNGRLDDGSYIEPNETYTLTGSIRCPSTCQEIEIEKQLSIEAHKNLLFLQLYKFDRPTLDEPQNARSVLAYYSPRPEDVKETIGKWILAASEKPSLSISLESYASYLQIHEGSNIMLAKRRSNNAITLLGIGEMDIERNSCGHNCETPGCSKNWCDVMKGQVEAPAKRAASRATIMVINRK